MNLAYGQGGLKLEMNIPPQHILAKCKGRLIIEGGVISSEYSTFLVATLSVFHPLQNVNRETKIKGENGKEYYVMDVVAQILKYLKSELINHLQRSEHPLEATDFDWVITVPAIWGARGKQMMREAGYKVNLAIST